jgi:hypothetical protein
VTALVPDMPRWVEVRGMLVSGRGQLLDIASTTPPAFVVVRPDNGIGAVIGGPSRAAIAELERLATEVLVEPEHADWVGSALRDWRREERRVYTQGEPRRHVTSGARQATHRELLTWPGIPAELREQLLLESDGGTPVYVAFAGDRAVSFCYPSAVTETWWKVAVVTLPEYRRQGFAMRAVATGIEEMRTNGRHPVWGAARGTEVSARLAQRLGFAAVDTMVVFSRP